MYLTPTRSDTAPTITVPGYGPADPRQRSTACVRRGPMTASDLRHRATTGDDPARTVECTAVELVVGHRRRGPPATHRESTVRRTAPLRRRGPEDLQPIAGVAVRPTHETRRIGVSVPPRICRRSAPCSVERHLVGNADLHRCGTRLRNQCPVAVHQRDPAVGLFDAQRLAERRRRAECHLGRTVQHPGSHRTRVPAVCTQSWTALALVYYHRDRHMTDHLTPPSLGQRSVGRAAPTRSGLVEDLA